MLKKEGFTGAKIVRAKPYKPKTFKSSIIKGKRSK
jgi:hypothetical protein